jgi:hypothetical protein
MECYVPNDARGTSRVNALSSMCFSMATAVALRLEEL